MGSLTLGSTRSKPDLEFQTCLPSVAPGRKRPGSSITLPVLRMVRASCIVAR